jgi:hypothetical protein
MNSARLLVAGSVAVFSGYAQADETPRAWPAEVAPELQRIQQELGGSIVRGYSTDWNEDAAAPKGVAQPPATAAPRQAGGAVWASDDSGRSRGVALRIEALREAATKLDAMANALERLELYSQADALRSQAQRLRLDARELTGERPSSEAAVTPSPAPGGDPIKPPVPQLERPEGEISPPPLVPQQDEGPLPENQRPPAYNAPGREPQGAELPPVDPVPAEERPEGELSPAPLSE